MIELATRADLRYARDYLPSGICGLIIRTAVQEIIVISCQNPQGRVIINPDIIM